jgi:hypothetical protein
MAITQKNTYAIGSNNDLTNALAMIDLNRILAQDRVRVFDDSGTLKVAVGSLVEANGSIYQVETAAETPSGSPAVFDFLYFDDSGPSFEWSSAVGTWSDTLQGWYNSGKKRLGWQVLNTSTPEAYAIRNVPPGSLEYRVLEIGDWNMNVPAAGVNGVSVAHGLSNFKKIRTMDMVIRNDMDTLYYHMSETRSGSPSSEAWIEAADSTNIEVETRNSSGSFNDVDFDSTSYNRGWVFVEYLAE